MLDDQHFIPWLAPGGTLAGPLRSPLPERHQRRLQPGPKQLKRNRRQDHHQRILLGIKLLVAPRQIEKTRLGYDMLPVDASA